FGGQDCGRITLDGGSKTARVHSGETMRLKVAPRALHKAHLRLVLFRFALILVGLRAVRLVFCASCGAVAKSSMISMVRAVRLVVPYYVGGFWPPVHVLG